MCIVQLSNYSNRFAFAKTSTRNKHPDCSSNDNVSVLKISWDGTNKYNENEQIVKCYMYRYRYMRTCKDWHCRINAWSRLRIVCAGITRIRYFHIVLLFYIAVTCYKNPAVILQGCSNERKFKDWGAPFVHKCKHATYANNKHIYKWSEHRKIHGTIFLCRATIQV